MDFTLRDFISSDRDFFIKSSQMFYDSPATDHAVPTENFERTFDICLQGSPYVQGMVFLVDDQHAGHALISYTYSNEAGGLSVLLDEIFILPKYQGQGIASKFFEAIENLYIVNGKANRLRLEVSHDNPGAEKLYSRLGFKKLDYIQMVKEFPRN